MRLKGFLATIASVYLFASTSWSQQPQGDTASPADYARLGGLTTDQAPLATPQIPPEFQNLSAEHIAYIEQLLDMWERSSSQVKLCTCNFQRWDYDPSIVAIRNPNDNRLAAHRIVRGQIRYSTPDKAQYESDEMWTYQNPDAETPYVQQTGDADHEKWICNGESIFAFDYKNKKLYEEKIPGEMQGNGLAESPLPFLFGAKRQQILDRYWIKVATPVGVENEYWLEAVPKRADDAKTYSKVEIILSREDILPKALHIYSPNYDPATTAISQSFEFSDRKINSQLAKLQNFMDWFIRPRTPINWERVDVLAAVGPVPSANAGNPQFTDRNAATEQPNTINRK